MNEADVLEWLGGLPASPRNREGATWVEALLAENAGLRAAAGRVPESWNECADWLERFGAECVVIDDEGTWRPTRNTADAFRDPIVMGRTGPPAPDLAEYRLLPPPNLVAAPPGMDGGGFLGAGADVPEGWEWRSHLAYWITSVSGRPAPNKLVQCRPSVPARTVVEVPLTKLVGRTIEGEQTKVESYSGDRSGVSVCMTSGKCVPVTFTADDRIRVYAEADA